MTEQNKQTLELANAAVTSGDYEGFLSYCTEDTIWTFVGEQTLQGKEAVRDYMDSDLPGASSVRGGADDRGWSVCSRIGEDQTEGY